MIRSWENIEILLKGTTKKLGSQKGGPLNFLKQLMSILTSLAENVLVPLELTAAAPAKDIAIQKKIFRPGMTALIISNKEMEDIIKIVQSLEESGLLTKGVRETIKNETKQQKSGFFGIRQVY